MLVDLQALDVVPRQRDTRLADDGQQPDSSLRLQAPAKGVSADHKGADISDEHKQDDEVAIDTVEEQCLVSDDGDELPDHEQASWENGTKVEGYANAAETGMIPVPLARRRTVSEAAGGSAADVEIGEAGERKAKHGASEDYD